MSPENEREMARDLSRVASLLEEMNMTLRRIEESQADANEKTLGQLRGVRSETKHVGLMAAWCGLAALFFVVPQVLAWFKA